MELAGLEAIWKRTVVNDNALGATASQARSMATEVLSMMKARSVEFLPTFRSVNLSAVLEYFDNRAPSEIEDMIDKIRRETTITRSQSEATFSFSIFGNAIFKSMLPKIEMALAAVVVQNEAPPAQNSFIAL